MTFFEAVIRPVARIITHTPIRVWGVFRLLAWPGSWQWRASTLGLRLRQLLKKLAAVQSANRFLANQG